MFRSSDRTRGMYTLLLRVFIGILILVFGLGSAGQVTPVQAAPNSELVAIYQVEVYPPPEPLCVGRSYSLRVRVVISTQQILDGKVLHETKAIVGQAKISAAPVGFFELNPTLQVLQTSWRATGTNRAGEVTFKIRGQRAEKSPIVFAVDTPDKEKIDFHQDLQFVHCKYKVKALYRRSVTGFAVLGNMSTTIQGDGQQLTGSGIMDAKSTVNAECGVTITNFLGPTDVTATSSADGEQLNLSFTYHSAATTTSARCPEFQLTFTKTQDPTSFLIASATLPSSGGSRTFAAPLGGTMTITAQPVEEGAGS